MYTNKIIHVIFLVYSIIILIVTYYIIMAYEEIDQKFSGKWKVDRSENFEAFLQEVGMYM